VEEAEEVVETEGPRKGVGVELDVEETESVGKKGVGVELGVEQEVKLCSIELVGRKDGSTVVLGESLWMRGVPDVENVELCVGQWEAEGEWDGVVRVEVERVREGLRETLRERKDVFVA